MLEFGCLAHIGQTKALAVALRFAGTVSDVTVEARPAPCRG